MKPQIVFLATAWGTRFGGINSFNMDLARALAGSMVGRRFEVTCVVTTAPTHEYALSGVRVLTIRSANPNSLGSEDVEAVVQAVAENGRRSRVLWWVGHDVVTGGAAVRAARLSGGKSAVIHHMSYIDYICYKHSVGVLAQEKFELQRCVFYGADQVLAVGPLLQERLATMLERNSDSVPMLIPGLAEVTPPPHPPSGFTALAFGRLDPENDRIKQGRLVVAGFSRAIRDARMQQFPRLLLEAPCLKLIGAQDQERELKSLAEKEAGGVVNLLALPFEESRDKLFSELRQANLAMMLSWHEGFGLAAWEAIAAGVPLLIGKNSGVYRLVEQVCSGAGTGCLQGIDVKATEDHEQNAQPQDVTEAASAILRVAADVERARRDAQILRNMLIGCTWSNTANQFAQALGLVPPTGHVLDTEVPRVPISFSPLWCPVRYGQDSGPSEVESANVARESARLHYRRGEYAESYAASRHAANLFARGGFHTDAVECLTEAITALRPIRTGDRLRETVLRVETLCVRHKIDPVARWQFLDRLALILFDYARSRKAAQVQRAAAQLREGIDEYSRNLQKLEFDSANSRRRAAVIKGCARTFARGENIQKLLAEVIDEARAFSKAHHFNAFITNLDVASKLASEVLGDRDLAHEYSEEALEWNALTDNWWVQQEHLWREFQYFRRWKKDKAKMLQNAIEAIKLHNNHPVVLEPIFDNREPGPHNPYVDNLVRFEIKDSLAERAIQITEPISIVPFALTDKQIDDLVNRITD